MVGDLWEEGFSPCSPLFAPKEGQKVPEEMEEPSVGGKVGGHKDTVTAVISVSIKRHLTSSLTFFFFFTCSLPRLSPGLAPVQQP